jgi:hypothetical protein
MMGQLYNQMMRSRMGLGQRFEGYGGFSPQVTSQQVATNPMAEPVHSLPAPTPWVHQPEGGSNPVDAFGGKGYPMPEGGPGGPPKPMPTNPVDTTGRQSQYGGGMQRNPWQRF